MALPSTPVTFPSGFTLNEGLSEQGENGKLSRVVVCECLGVVEVVGV